MGWAAVIAPAAAAAVTVAAMEAWGTGSLTLQYFGFEAAFGPEGGGVEAQMLSHGLIGCCVVKCCATNTADVCPTGV
jgi:hypothetical protein